MNLRADMSTTISRISKVRRLLWGAECALVLLVGMSLPAEGRILLESICTVEGQHEQRIIGLGLVVGLNKTRFPAVRLVSPGCVSSPRAH